MPGLRAGRHLPWLPISDVRCGRSRRACGPQESSWHLLFACFFAGVVCGAACAFVLWRYFTGLLEEAPFRGGRRALAAAPERRAERGVWVIDGAPASG